MAERRKDSKKRVLKEGEYQRSNGTYEYRWRSENVTAVMESVQKRGTRPSMTFTSSGCN